MVLLQWFYPKNGKAPKGWKIVARRTVLPSFDAFLCEKNDMCYLDEPFRPVGRTKCPKHLRTKECPAQTVENTNLNVTENTSGSALAVAVPKKSTKTKE